MKCVLYLLLMVIVNQKVDTMSAGENCTSALESSQNYGNTSCPPWFFFNGTDCQCGSDLDGWVHCNQQTHASSVLTCHCMTSDNNTGVTVGGSLYCCFKNDLHTYIPQNISDLNEAMCGQFNRQGRLCGQCKEGFLPPVYSYNLHCINCTYSRYSWVKYVTFAFGPLTVFFLTVIIFSISPTNTPTLTAFVLMCQLFCSPQVLRAVLPATDGNIKSQTLARVLTTVYSIWNLDFFRTLLPPICLPLTTLQVLALDYAIALYPLLLIVIAYILIELHAHGCRPVVWLWKPFSTCFIRFRRQWDLKTSTIDAFATFLLLSYVKIASVSFDLLLPTELYNVQGERLKGRYLYYDATVEYFGNDHLPYAILASLVLLVFNVLPLLLLLLYPARCFQRCFTHLRVESLALKIFMDAFQGCYKDGTTGTRDYRYFSAIYVGTRLLLLITYTLTLNSYSWSLVSTVFAVLSILYTIFQPYKFHIYNLIDPIIFLVTALWGFSIPTLYAVQSVAPHFILFSSSFIYLLSTLPLVYITGVFLNWFLCKKKVPQKILVKLHFINRSRIDNSTTLPDRLINPEQYERLLPEPVGEGYNSCSNNVLPTY